MSSPNKLVINYLKTNGFETKFFTGAIGGASVTGHIDLNLYLDRIVIPKVVTHEINPDGTLKMPPVEERRDGIMREVHTGLKCDLKTAIALYEWLGTQIKILEEIEKINANNISTN